MTVATLTDKKPEPTDFSDLAGQVDKGNKQVLHYSRSRFLMTWLALGGLAILIGITMLVAIQTADTNLEQTDDIARVANTTADAAAQDTDDIVAYMRGEQGIPGVPGTSGEDGTPGLPGGSGEPGEPGPEGPKGDQGSPGSMGVNGPVGPQGLAGIAGPLGPAGVGEQGPKGDKGDEGARGAEGPTGPAGPQGPPGSAAPPFQVNTVIAIGQSANDTTTPKTANATCTTGRASGGGFAVNPSDPGIIVTASSPVGNTGWNATAEVLSLPPGTNWQIFAFVTCVSG
jgi:Collagen triple helix repeat (20 copies)